MITRPLQNTDIERVREIHEKYYREEFHFPDFAKNFLTTFKISKSNGEIITAGGIKLFPELIAITEQEHSASIRAFALQSAMQIATLVSYSYGELFCSALENSKWNEQVKSVGFQNSMDHNLVLHLQNEDK